MRHIIFSRVVKFNISQTSSFEKRVSLFKIIVKIERLASLYRPHKFWRVRASRWKRNGTDGRIPDLYIFEVGQKIRPNFFGSKKFVLFRSDVNLTNIFFINSVLVCPIWLPVFFLLLKTSKKTWSKKFHSLVKGL